MVEKLSADEVKDYAIKWAKKQGHNKPCSSNASEIRFGGKGSIKVDLTGKYAGVAYSFEEDKCLGSVLPRDKREGYRAEFDPGEEPAAESTPPTMSTHDAQPDQDDPSEAEQAQAEANRKRAHIREQWDKAEPLPSTPGEQYLKSRGLDLDDSNDQLRWAPAYQHTPDGQPGGAILCPLRDEAGQLQGLSAIWVSEFGSKAGREPPKPLYVAEQGLHLTGRLGDPTATTLVLAEGLETGLSRLMVGAADLRVCFGAVRYCEPAPTTREVEVLADRDQIARARGVARCYDCAAYVVIPDPETGDKGDLNDQLQRFNLDGVQRVLAQRERVTQATGDQRTKGAKLTGNSDVAVARDALHTIENHHGTTVFAEGALWYYDDRQFHTFDPSTIQRCIYTLDNAVYEDANGNPRRLNISKGRAESIAGVMANIRSEVPEFFTDSSRPPMIPCSNGVLVFDPVTGNFEFSGHHRDHRNRHLLPGTWEPDLLERLEDLEGYRKTLLGKLVQGCFCDDTPEDRREKIRVLQEVAGAIAAGYGTQLREPKAVIGVGPKGGNGKSQWSDVFLHMAAKEATRSISPSKFADDYHVVGLVGAVANIVNELPVRAVSGDAFKQVISGEEVRGRQIYKAPSQFRPIAQHWYTCNEVPIFMGGIDGGVYRRLLFIPFDRVIPDEERIPHLGERIAREQPDLLLAFAILGLQRLIRNRDFTVPASSRQALDEAVAEADPVRAWARAWLHEVKPGMGPGLRAAEAYEYFKVWYTSQGYKSVYRPNNIAFGKRVRNVFPNRQDRHLRTGTLWTNLDIRSEDTDGSEAA